MDIEGYWDAVFRQDAEKLRGYFAPGAEVRWHCTNERFTADEFIRANCEYPGEWSGSVERVERMGELTVTVARVVAGDGGASFHAVSFIKLEGDKISSIDEYWSDDAPAPDWRREKNIGKTIK